MDENKDTDSNISAINMTKSETTSGHETSLQAQFVELFVKIVSTAFAECTTSLTKNIPKFEAHWKRHVEEESFCDKKKTLFDDLQFMLFSGLKKF